MKVSIPSSLKGKLMYAAIIVACLIVLGLGFAGVVSWDSPAEKAAEELFQMETGIDVKPPVTSPKP